jgi:hypothetical protein
MSSYDETRQAYKPEQVLWLLIAESPPPQADQPSSRHFYRAQPARRDDRLFTNTIQALYQAAAELTEAEIQADKEDWLRRLQADGIYMIEALETSQRHQVTKRQRQDKIAAAAPRLVERARQLRPKKGIVLIKSNVFDQAGGPLRQAGLKVLNKELVDYPGHFNQRAYRQKLRDLLVATGWTN